MKIHGEREKRKEIAIMLTDKAIDILTEAIFTQACHEYVHGRKRQLQGKSIPEGCDPDELKAFFRGEGNSMFPLMYPKMNSEYLIEELEAEVQKEMAV